MQFKFEDFDYFITFQRRFKPVQLQRNGKTIEQPTSTYPYTTAFLLRKELDGKKEIVAEHEVGCLPVDQYSNEAGRIAALRGLTKLLSKSLRASVWQAYMNRAETEKKSKKA